MKIKTLLILVLVAIAAITILLLVKFDGRKMATVGKTGSRTDIKAAIGPEPASLDPAINIDTYVSVYISHLLEGLTKYDENNQLIPAMADHWTVSKDGLVYTFFLKNGIKWSDGVDVKAQDFEYAWKRVLSPETASKYADPLFYIKNAKDFNKGLTKDVGIKVLDEKTLQITLERPTSFFPSLVAIQPFFPARKDIIEKYGDSWSQNAVSYIGNGPFVLRAWNHNQDILMVKNENYYEKDKVKISTVDWKMVDDDTAALNAFDAGEIDFHTGFIDTSELPRLYAENKAKKIDAVGVSYVIFNTKRPPFNDSRVRQALSLSVDRKGLVDVLQDGSEPAKAFISYGIPSVKSGSDFRTDEYSENFISDQPNIEAAKKLLADAGYPDGKGLKVFDFLTAKDSTNVKIAEYLQDQWSKINVKIKINSVESNVRNQLREDGQYDITKGSWGSDYLDPNSFLYGFLSDSVNNYGRWQNKAYDEKVTASIEASTKVEEIKYAHEAEKIMMDDMAIAPLFYPSFNVLSDPKLKSVYVNSLRRVMFTTAYWDK